MVGSKRETFLGRPYVAGAKVIKPCIVIVLFLDHLIGLHFSVCCAVSRLWLL